jgi:hypothetical protein
MNIKLYFYLLIFYFQVFLGACLASMADGEGRNSVLDEETTGSPVACSRFISRVSEEYYSLDRAIKIRCWKSTSLDSGQSPVKMKYTIFLEDKDIGCIHVNYYEKGGCYKTHDHQFISDPTVHVTFITIVEYERKNGYAKRALDALFHGIKSSPFLATETLIGLEYDVDKPFLGHFYRKYGFQESPPLCFIGYENPSIYSVMLTRLGKLKFF